MAATSTLTPTSPSTTTAMFRPTPQHRNSKSIIAVTSQMNLSPQPRRPPFPPAHQLQSSPRIFDKAPQSPKAADGPSKKKRRQRKPRDSARNSPEQSTATMDATPRQSPQQHKATLSPSAIPRSTPERLPSTTTSTTIVPEQVTPTKSASVNSKAYAGPTFHHSPAPSSLPVPKFFSNSATIRRRHSEDESTDGSQPSSPSFDNPLEQLFRADREEKARNRKSTDSSDNESAPESSSRDIFSMDPESPARHIFNTPRNRVAPQGAKHSVARPLFTADSPKATSPTQPGPQDQENDRRAKALALRQYLLQQPGSPFSASNASPTSASGYAVSPQGSPAPRRFTPRTINLGHKLPELPGYSPSAATHLNRPHFANIFDARSDGMRCQTESRDFTDMENSLRQILKLEPRPHLASRVMT